jgi:hypothetical protein
MTKFPLETIQTYVIKTNISHKLKINHSVEIFTDIHSNKIAIMKKLIIN